MVLRHSDPERTDVMLVPRDKAPAIVSSPARRERATVSHHASRNDDSGIEETPSSHYVHTLRELEDIRAYLRGHPKARIRIRTNVPEVKEAIRKEQRARSLYGTTPTRILEKNSSGRGWDDRGVIMSEAYEQQRVRENIEELRMRIQNTALAAVAGNRVQEELPVNIESAAGMTPENMRSLVRVMAFAAKNNMKLVVRSGDAEVQRLFRDAKQEWRQMQTAPLTQKPIIVRPVLREEVSPRTGDTRAAVQPVVSDAHRGNGHAGWWKSKARGWLSRVAAVLS